MPDHSGRLDPNELKAVRGGVGQSTRAGAEAAAAAGFSLSDMLNAAVPDEHAPTFEAAKARGAIIQEINQQAEAVCKFLNDFRAETSADFAKYKNDLGAKSFDSIFGKAIKSGDFTQGRVMTDSEKHAIEVISVVHVTKLHKLGGENVESFAGDVGKLRQSLGLSSDF